MTLVPVVLATALFASPAANAFPGCDSFFAAAYPNSTTENLGGCQTCCRVHCAHGPTPAHIAQPKRTLMQPSTRSSLERPLWNNTTLCVP